MPIQNGSARTCWLAYPLKVKENAGFTRTEMQIYLEERNIQTRVVFTGNVLRQPMMSGQNFVGNADDFVNADQVMKNGILLACHHGLTSDMKEHLYSSIEAFIETRKP